VTIEPNSLIGYVFGTNFYSCSCSLDTQRRSYNIDKPRAALSS
jgi:hypothetical protein